MEKILSIIVPVYNKDLFINECIESIHELEIEKNSIEAIFIDDCSTDQSLSVLREYEEKYSFIKVIQMNKNSGSPSQPRNLGVEKAAGKYLTFLDADDWLDSKGFPELLNQIVTYDSDIGFGQSIRHSDSSIRKIGRFTSYKVANGHRPYEINKIFRAVGPPGKIIKRKVIVDNNIKFKHMKYGEDKLFFIEAISKCATSSMNNIPVYHVNRFKSNKSLVGETDIIEKSKYNLIVLEEILKLKLPEKAEFQALSRIVEVDFISRLLNNERFLKSPNKDDFYNIFMKMKKILIENHKTVEDYIIETRFKDMYRLLNNKDFESLNLFINTLFKRGQKNRFISNNQLVLSLPESLKDCSQVVDECFAVYQGTHLINEKSVEVLRVYKKREIVINKVLLTGINNDLNEKQVDFIEYDEHLHLKTEDIMNCDFSFNITIIFSDYKACVVNTNLPNGAENLKLKRQNYKAEFIIDSGKSDVGVYLDKYYTYNPGKVFTLKKINLYEDRDFKTLVNLGVEPGEVLNINEITATNKGTPRFITKEGLYFTANKKFVKNVTEDRLEEYLVKQPDRVRIIKKCKEYNNRKFKDGLLNVLRVGEELEIQKMVMTPKGTPRLKTINGSYITANRKYVKEVENNI